MSLIKCIALLYLSNWCAMHLQCMVCSLLYFFSSYLSNNYDILWIICKGKCVLRCALCNLLIGFPKFHVIKCCYAVCAPLMWERKPASLYGHGYFKDFSTATEWKTLLHNYKVYWVNIACSDSHTVALSDGMEFHVKTDIHFQTAERIYLFVWW